jgi:macrolide-specific efflux system membrane fusion protein
MKILKLLLITLVLGSVSILSLGCPGEAATEPTSESQVATVQRGNLTVDITASGNLSLSRIEDLAFDIPGAQDITVAEVTVEEGDSVEEGQVLATLDTSEWNDMLVNLERDLLQAQINLDNAQLALDKAEDQTVTLITGDIVYSSNYDDEEIDILELQVELAEARLDDAQKALDEAQEKSPEIIAPFDGFIASVNVEGGDEVLSGTVAVTIADPDQFEADILVSEMDIFDLELGGEATVQVDAMTSLTIPATVTYISPTATISSGVVNYDVTVQLESLEELMQAQQEAMPDISSGELPEPMKQAIEEGQMTQEEAEAMLEQMQQAQAEQQAAFENFQLREGLTVTVSIIIGEATDVLLVPNGAITTRGQQNYVQVVSADGSIEERAVTTGISNWQYTEVNEGLSEGEQVVVTGTTSTTTETNQFGPPGGRMIIPMGGPPG